jgi:Cdc6-like AAA superfamily ATPase
MRVPINYKKLTNAARDEDNKSTFVFSEETNSIIQGLINHIDDGEPSAILVTGYRGTGKSSILSELKSRCESKHQSILPDQYIIVKTDFSKKSDHEFVLRSLIRELYFSIIEKGSVNQTIKKNITNLFRQTFNTVQNIDSIKHSVENTTELKFNVGLLIGSIASLIVYLYSDKTNLFYLACILLFIYLASIVIQKKILEIIHKYCQVPDSVHR